MSPTLKTGLLSACTKAEMKDALSVEKRLTGRSMTGPAAARGVVEGVEQAAVGSACLEKEEELGV